MADPIIPAGAFAAMKAGKPQPTAAAPKTEAKAAPAKPEPKAEPKTAPKEAPVKAEEPPKNLTPAEKKIWKLKADGEEFDFDATDEEAVKREIMKARGADKRFQTAAELKKQAETFFEMIKNPATLKKVLADPRIGVDVKKFAEDFVWEQIQEGKMTPEQKAQREKDREYEQLKADKAKSEQQKAAEKKAADSARFETSYNEKITKALELGGIPKTPGAVTRMAEYLMTSLNKGLDLSAEELVAQVRKDYTSDFTSVLGGASEDQVLEFLGEAIAEKLRKADLKRLKSTQSAPFAKRSAAKEAASGKKEAPKRQTGSAWKEDVQREFLSRSRK